MTNPTQFDKAVQQAIIRQRDAALNCAASLEAQLSIAGAEIQSLKAQLQAAKEEAAVIAAAAEGKGA
jgi:hypothetical protein